MLPPLAELDAAALPPGRHRLRCRVADDAACDVVVLRGDACGPLLLAVGAVHGDEYEGPAALRRLAAELDPAALSGTAVLIPVLNEPAHYLTARCGPDGENLARVFPGDVAGSVTHQIAASLTALMARADAFVDLHAAGTYYTLYPWAGYASNVAPEVLSVQRCMAFAFGLDFVWGTPMKPGRSLSAAAELGVPAIYVEMTGSGLCRPEDVHRNVIGMEDVLSCVGLLAEPYRTASPRWLRESAEADEGHLQIDHPAPRQGIWQAAVGLWDEVTEGQTLGAVVAPGGGAAVPVPSLRSGRVAMLRTAPPVNEGDYLAVVVEV